MYKSVIKSVHPLGTQTKIQNLDEKFDYSQISKSLKYK